MSSLKRKASNLLEGLSPQPLKTALALAGKEASGLKARPGSASQGRSNRPQASPGKGPRSPAACAVGFATHFRGAD